MNYITLQRRFNKINYLEKIHKQILHCLFDQYFSPEEEKCLTENAIREITDYTRTPMYMALKDLVNWGYISKVDKHYQLEQKLLYEVGKISFESFVDKSNVVDLSATTQERLMQFLSEIEKDIIFTNRQKEELMRDTSRSSNMYETIHHHFVEYAGETKGKQLFNMFMKTNKMIPTE